MEPKKNHVIFALLSQMSNFRKTPLELIIIEKYKDGKDFSAPDLIQEFPNFSRTLIYSAILNLRDCGIVQISRMENTGKFNLPTRVYKVILQTNEQSS